MDSSPGSDRENDTVDHDKLAVREDDGWKQLFELLDKVPFVSGLKRDISRLRRLIAERRPLRVGLFGNAGSGRSRLANGLMGAPVLREGVKAKGDWVHVDAQGRKVEWCELSPGHVLPEQKADVLVLVVTPNEVEAGLGAVLEGFISAMGRTFETEPKAFVALTQCDELPPANAAPPFPDEKQNRIELVQQRLRRQLSEAGLSLPAPFALSVPGPKDQWLGVPSWGLQPLSEALTSAAPEEAAVESARAFDAPEAVSRTADMLIQACSTLAITVALAPVPLSDIALLTPLQGTMVSTLAYMSGRGLDNRSVAEWIGSVGVVGGMGFGFRLVARQVVKLLPGAGSVVAGSIAGAGTLALGRSAKRYFLETADRRK